MFPFVPYRNNKIPKGIFIVFYFYEVPAGILLTELLLLMPSPPNWNIQFLATFNVMG